jgi:hypothetical protein
MDNRKRRAIAAAVLVFSVLVVGYLVVFTPSQSTIASPTPTVHVTNNGGSLVAYV